MDLHFRPLTEADIATMHRWLNDPLVIEWWEGDDVSWAGVVAEYRPDPSGTLEHWIVEWDDRAVGWIQCYQFDDERSDETTWTSLGVNPQAAGIDYLIGESRDRHRGFGSQMLAGFVDQVVFGRHPNWTQVVADPHVGNVASWRALEKAGFRELGIIDNTWKLMGLDRQANEPVRRPQRAIP